MTQATPPRWAEEILSLVVPHDFESVAGDLLEDYRERIVPQLGRSAADRWYVTQVMGFVLRGTWIWGVLFGVAHVTRAAWDVFVPTSDFSTRSAITTWTALALLLIAGFTAARRSRSWLAGSIAGVTTAVIAAAITWVGGGLLFALRHDAGTLLAFEHSGGLAEFIGLPIVATIPGMIVGTIGGALGRVGKLTS
jgi:hypothetical protein